MAENLVFSIQKLNRLSFFVGRILIVDFSQESVSVWSSDQTVCKTQIPFSQIASIERKKERRCVVTFRSNKRQYELQFRTPEDRESFISHVPILNPEMPLTPEAANTYRSVRPNARPRLNTTLEQPLPSQSLSQSSELQIDNVDDDIEDLSARFEFVVQHKGTHCTLMIAPQRQSSSTIVSPSMRSEGVADYNFQLIDDRLKILVDARLSTLTSLGLVQVGKYQVLLSCLIMFLS